MFGKFPALQQSELKAFLARDNILIMIIPSETELRNIPLNLILRHY